MRRTTIAQEHKKFFQINGYISFEELLSSAEMEEIAKAIHAHQSEIPGLAQENLFRAVPAILPLARKMGKIAAALLDRKPIRLKYDSYVERLEQIPPIEERELGLLLAPNGKGVFFIDTSHLYKEDVAWYLLLVFTANYVNNPLVFQ